MISCTGCDKENPSNRSLDTLQRGLFLTILTIWSDKSRLVGWLCSHRSFQDPGSKLHVVFNHLHLHNWSCWDSRPWRSKMKCKQLSFKWVIWKWHPSLPHSLQKIPVIWPHLVARKVGKHSLWSPHPTSRLWIAKSPCAFKVPPHPGLWSSKVVHDFFH